MNQALSASNKKRQEPLFFSDLSLAIPNSSILPIFTFNHKNYSNSRPSKARYPGQSFRTKMNLAQQNLFQGRKRIFSSNTDKISARLSIILRAAGRTPVVKPADFPKNQDGHSL
jgi:hypothetical protein